MPVAQQGECNHIGNSHCRNSYQGTQQPQQSWLSNTLTLQLPPGTLRLQALTLQQQETLTLLAQQQFEQQHQQHKEQQLQQQQLEQQQSMQWQQQRQQQLKQ